MHHSVEICFHGENLSFHHLLCHISSPTFSPYHYTHPHIRARCLLGHRGPYRWQVEEIGLEGVGVEQQLQWWAWHTLVTMTAAKKKQTCSAAMVLMGLHL